MAHVVYAKAIARHASCNKAWPVWPGVMLQVCVGTYHADILSHVFSYNQNLIADN